MRSDVYLPVALVILTASVFYPVLGHDFVDYDDFTFVVRNPNVQHGITFEGVSHAFTSEYEANWIPLTWISHMLDVQLFGMNPAGHHLTNLLLHIFNTFLLYVFFRRTTGAAVRSAAVALLFAVHPLHVESVAWVAERKDVLSAFFWMLTINAYACYADKPLMSRYLIVLTMFIMGLLSKPMVITLPLVMLLLDFWPLGRMNFAGAEFGRLDGGNMTKLIREKIPFMVFSVCAGVITLLAHRNDISHALSLLEKAARAAVTYISYLGKMLWPVELSVIYPFSAASPALWKVLLAVLIILGITVAAFVKRRCFPYFITGWLWYLVTLLPVIGLVHIGHHSMADRYTYIPLIGVFLIVVWGVQDVLTRWSVPKAVTLILAMLIMVSLVVITARQLQYWENSITLFSRAVEVTENNWIAHNNLGKVVLDEGRIDEAIFHFRKSLEANPSFALAYLNMGFAHYYKYDFASARAAFENALKLDSSCHPAHLGLGLVYLALGKMKQVYYEYNILLRLGSGYASELMSAIADYNNAASSIVSADGEKE